MLYPPDDQEIKVLEIGHVGFTYCRDSSVLNGRVFDSIAIGKRENVGLLTADFLTF